MATTRVDTWHRGVHFLVAIGLWLGAGAAWSLTLTPDRLALPGAGSQGQLTVTIQVAQPFPVIVALSASPETVVLVPSTVTVPAFELTAIASVTALVDMGSAIVTATDGSGSASAEITVGSTAMDCTLAVNQAVASANTYITQMQALEPACRSPGRTCNQAIAAANAALKALAAQNKSVAPACKQ